MYVDLRCFQDISVLVCRDWHSANSLKIARLYAEYSKESWQYSFLFSIYISLQIKYLNNTADNSNIQKITKIISQTIPYKLVTSSQGNIIQVKSTPSRELWQSSTPTITRTQSRSSQVLKGQSYIDENFYINHRRHPRCKSIKWFESPE
jgi:hypothetical protein